MSQEVVLGIIGAVAVVVAAILGAPRLGRDARSRIAKDLEILKSLPDSSAVKQQFLNDIEGRVRQLYANDADSDAGTASQRSGTQIALGITILVLAIALGLLVVTGGGWWWLASPVVVFLLLLGGVGLGLGLKKAPRDEKGNLVK